MQVPHPFLVPGLVLLSSTFSFDVSLFIFIFTSAPTNWLTTLPSHLSVAENINCLNMGEKPIRTFSRV